MKIFLTGAAGFLGSHIAYRLAMAGHQVVGLTRKPGLPTLLRETDVEFHMGNLLEPETFASRLKGVEVVIHTAAQAAFGVKDPADFYRVNRTGTQIILQAAQQADVSRFIHTSTRGTIGVAANPEESTESDPLATLNASDDYVKSKCQAEAEVRKQAQKNTMACVILSPTALIGTHDERPTPIGNIVLSFLKGKVKTYMEGRINLIDVEDAATAFLAALTKGNHGEVYVLGNQNISLLEMFQHLATVSGVPAPKIKVPYPAAHVVAFIVEHMSNIVGITPFATVRKVETLHHSYSCFNPQKAIRELGAVPGPIAKTLIKTVYWFQSHHALS